MNRTLLFTQRRCSVFDGTHKVTLLAQKSHQVAAFCVSETNAECKLMFSQVSQRPSGSWKQRGNFLTCSGNYQCLELRLQSSFGRRGHEKTLYWPTKRPCKRSSIVEHELPEMRKVVALLLVVTVQSCCFFLFSRRISDLHSWKGWDGNADKGKSSVRNQRTVDTGWENLCKAEWVFKWL